MYCIILIHIISMHKSQPVTPPERLLTYHNPLRTSPSFLPSSNTTKHLEQQTSFHALMSCADCRPLMGGPLTMDSFLSDGDYQVHNPFAKSPSLNYREEVMVNTGSTQQ